MTRRGLALGASLLAIALMESDRVAAQIVQEPSARGDLDTTSMPVVLSGSDVGFRVVRMDGQIPVGQMVVRIKGAWVTAEVSS